MNSIVIAFQLLTIIPIPYHFIASDKEFANSCLYYPLVGLFIGFLLLLIASLMLQTMPLNIVAVFILIIWVLLSGALHLDGLADCADAWVGGLGNRERSLAIMKDPASGPVAVVALILLLLLKWALIKYLLEQELFLILLFTPAIGRLAILILMLTTSYVRPSGMAETIIKHFPSIAAKRLSIVVLLVALYFVGLQAVILMLGLLWLIAFQANKRLGGVTGDVYGASVELVEITVLAGSLL